MTEEIVNTDDFSGFYLIDTAALDIELPNGEPMIYHGQQVVVHLYGPSTSRFIKAKASMDREASKRVVAMIGKKSQSKTESDDEADAKFLIAVTDRFDNFPFPGGIDAIYREPRFKYIHDQVRNHLNDLGNFFAPGVTSL